MREEKSIIFRHPGYPDMFGWNVLFRLYVFDDNDGAPGLHYQTALTVCAIVAGNAWDGFFTTRQDNQHIPHDAPQMLSPNHDYYFYARGSHTEPYVIIPTFADWIFPHDAIPSDFLSAAMTLNMQALTAPYGFSAADIQRDGSCRLSSYSDNVESAHLVPEEERDWLMISSMTVNNRDIMLSGNRF